MAVQWPDTLPKLPLQQGYSEKPQDQLLRSSMSAGPGKERRRFTAGFKSHVWTIIMSGVEVVIFEAFVENDLYAGALRFEVEHPRTGTVTEFKFTAPYSIAHRDGDNWNVTMPLKEMP